MADKKDKTAKTKKQKPESSPEQLPENYAYLEGLIETTGVKPKNPPKKRRGAPRKSDPKPFGWPENAPFYKSALSNSSVTIQDLPLKTRAILGMYKNHSNARRWSFKDLIIMALEEYLHNNSEELE